MKRILASLALCALAAVAARPVSAETLVKHCQQLSGTDCTAAAWVRPPDAQVVQVLRSTVSPWLPLADALSSDRIYVCIDDATLAVGANALTTKCATRVPGRTDNWQLKSLVYPTSPPATLGTVTFAWPAVTANTDGSALTDLAGYNVAVRRQDCDPASGNCAVAGYAAPLVLGDVLTFAVLNVAYQACVIVQARNASGDVGPVSDETCGSPPKPKLVPAKVTGVRVVTP